ncbi:hypothetical protein BFJ68_g3649 [Fusarium oxysporum]|uniref:Uncharacterized protein n=1 Tax=Fusarium oxysporum TaxID=5507 RepID=A0A420R3G8_FUSOX|nr:hypothetical protein BFJ71_g65 [Fusarium oxysporum]RKL19375.1 hypothetical protein BFJ68_g3649 [Fusarium oxysporum]
MTVSSSKCVRDLLYVSNYDVPNDLLSVSLLALTQQENASASNRRSASIASLNEQWNGPDWLPPDIRVGIVFVNLTHPPDGVNALIQDIDLTSDIATACDFDQVSSELVETAKARVISIGCIWEAKIQRDEALRVHVRYDDLERKMRDLQDEMATACDESNAKNQAFDEWKSVASNEDWEGIVADELLIDVRIVDSNM